MSYREVVREFNNTIVPVIQFLYEVDNVPDIPVRQNWWERHIALLESEGRIFIDSCEEWPFPAAT